MDSGQFSENEKKKEENLRIDRGRFFALIGHCIISYQQIEDYLLEIFINVVGIDRDRASGIFMVARGLDAKISMISAAISNQDKLHIERWNNLAKRIRRSFENRNQLAHGAASFGGSVIEIRTSSDPAIPASAKKVGEDLWWLIKESTAKQDYKFFDEKWRILVEKEKITGVWSLQRLQKEYRRNFDLFGFMVGFSIQLSGKPAPAHLLED